MHTVTEQQQSAPWQTTKQVLPQHTDHAGVMWHGTYVNWLEEARLDALTAVGLPYAAVSAAQVELPVVKLSLDYRQVLTHGETVLLHSWLLESKGPKLRWLSQFIRSDGSVAAEATVELVALDLSGGLAQKRLLRRLPPPLRTALDRLKQGPSQPSDPK